MSEQLLDLLKLGLLALLYLFFLRVIWAVWTELRAPVPARVPVGARGPARARGGRRREPKPRRRELTTVAIVEPPDLAGGRYPLGAEMTMGRAPGCTVVLDDTYVSQLHTRIFGQDGAYYVEDLGSTNGTYHNGDPVSGPERLHPGDRIQIGNVVLELS